MLLIDQRSGKEHRFIPTEEYLAESAAIDARYECAHDARSLMRIQQTNGSWHTKDVCVRCGHRSLSVARTPDHDQLPVDDGSVRRAFKSANEAELDSLRQRHLVLQLDRSSERQRKYDQYLESSRWKAKRALVMKRASGICEGCRERPASEVHHLNYDHFGDEFLFELVAICAPCHDRLHPPGDVPEESDDEGEYEDIIF